MDGVDGFGVYVTFEEVGAYIIRIKHNISACDMSDTTSVYRGLKIFTTTLLLKKPTRVLQKVFN